MAGQPFLSCSVVVQRQPACSPAGRSGFTLVELLVATAVIVLLIGLLLPVLASMRSSAAQTVEASAARQLMVAYNAYANVNRDWVLPGFKGNLPAHDASGTPIASLTNPVVAKRYPWRLAPFIDFNFRGLYVNALDELLERMEQTEYEDYVYVVSLAPTLGLNTEWVGGNEMAGAFNPNIARQYGNFYVRRSNEVRHTDRLMVFASARGIDPLQIAGSGPVEGHHTLRSPYFFEAQGYRWKDSFDENDDPFEFGFLSPRYEKHALCAFFDGHNEVLNTTKLKDMRHWANLADRPDWGLAPLSPP